MKSDTGFVKPSQTTDMQCKLSFVTQYMPHMTKQVASFKTLSQSGTRSETTASAKVAVNVGCMYKYVCVYVCMYVCVYVCMYVCINE